MTFIFFLIQNWPLSKDILLVKGDPDKVISSGHSSAYLVRIATWGLMLAIVVVPLLFGAAMFFFPPGHYGVANGYSFSRHVVSDLGRTRLSNGTPNTLSCVLFVAAMTVTGLACAMYWIARSTFLGHSVARRIVLVCGLIMSVLMVAIGVTPLNIVGRIHEPLTAATAVATALAVLAIFLDSSDYLENPRIKLAWFVVLVTVGTCWTALVVLHHERLLTFRPWLPLGQKTLITTFISWMIYQTALLFRVKI